MGIEASERLDFLNEKTQYNPTDAASGKLTLADGTVLDEYDFVVLKFRSLSTGLAVNFRATITGLSETTTPSWDNAKFIGSPFNYYTYSGIERSVTFNFKVYSTTPLQHIAAWQRLNFLTSLAYPQGYAGGIGVRAPFLQFTLGNMYKQRPCYIESLSYSVDDNSPWHVGFTEASGLADDSKFVINGQETSMDNYILPKIVDVAITLKLVEQRNNTEAGYLYGFDKLPRVMLKDKALSVEQLSKNSQIAGDSNNSNQLLNNITADNSKTKNNTDLTNANSQVTTVPASEANKLTSAVAGGVTGTNSGILGVSPNFKLPNATINPIAGMPPFKIDLPTFKIDNNKLLGTSFNSTKFNNSVFTGASNFNTAAASIIPTAGGLKFNSMGGLTPKPFSTSNILQTSFNSKVSDLASNKLKLNFKSGK